jgi:hypothetical protein
LPDLPTAGGPDRHPGVRTSCASLVHGQKSPGRPQRIDTQGFACPNRSCPYYHITDTIDYALVGDGAHGQRERRETFRCLSCGTTFSARRGYPLGDPL